MRTLLVIAAIASVALPATAQVTCCYSWEDGGTVFNLSGNATDATNVSGVQSGLCGSCAGGRSLNCRDGVGVLQRARVACCVRGGHREEVIQSIGRVERTPRRH